MTRDANIATTTTTTITTTPNITTTIPLSTTATATGTTATTTNNSFTQQHSQERSIVTLPPCIQHIFSFINRSELAKTSLVSKKWHQASSQRLWSSFKFVREREFERIFHILSRNTTTTTTRYGNFITSLELVHSDRDFSINSNHIFLITMLCPNLLSISITFHHTRPVAPPVVAAHLINNKQPQQQPSNPRLPLPMLARQQQQHHQLQPPQAPRHTTSLPLAHFAHNCPKLKSIQLVSYSPKTDDSVYEMAKYLTSQSLESIKFINCSTVQSSTLCKLAMTNPQLKCIEIMGNTPISDSSLATIADRCGLSLEYLSIGNAHQLTDKSIRYIAARCKKIRQICIFNNNIERISEDTLTSIITHCTNLQMISLSDSRALGAVFFHSVVQRVNIEMQNIYGQQAKIGSGLQTLRLGGVKRDMIQSKYIKELIDSSASKHDIINQAEDEEEDDDSDLNNMSDQISIPTLTSKFMPKSTVIRGNTIWWQRRRILLTSMMT